MNGGRVFHFGPYEGLEIEQVVEMDPLYIVEASVTKGHYIPKEYVTRARQLLDEHDDWDDFDFAEEQAAAFGFNTHEYNE